MLLARPKWRWISVRVEHFFVKIKSVYKYYDLSHSLHFHKVLLFRRVLCLYIVVYGMV